MARPFEAHNVRPATPVERRFAKRLLATAIRRAERSGDVFSHASNLWTLVVDAANKPRKGHK